MSEISKHEEAERRRAHYICTVCGEEQDSFLRPCEACGSRKIISSHFARFLYGEHYRELIKAGQDSVH